MFVVSDTLHIATVSYDGSVANITGAGFIGSDTIIEVLQYGSLTVVDTPSVTVTETNNLSVTTVLSTGTYDIRVTNLDGQTFTEVGAIIL